MDDQRKKIISQNILKLILANPKIKDRFIILDMFMKLKILKLSEEDIIYTMECIYLIMFVNSDLEKTILKELI